MVIVSDDHRRSIHYHNKLGGRTPSPRQPDLSPGPRFALIVGDALVSESAAGTSRPPHPLIIDRHV